VGSQPSAACQGAVSRRTTHLDATHGRPFILAHAQRPTHAPANAGTGVAGRARPPSTDLSVNQAREACFTALALVPFFVFVFFVCDAQSSTTRSQPLGQAGDAADPRRSFRAWWLILDGASVASAVDFCAPASQARDSVRRRHTTTRALQASFLFTETGLSLSFFSPASHALSQVFFHGGQVSLFLSHPPRPPRAARARPGGVAATARRWAHSPSQCKSNSKNKASSQVIFFFASFFFHPSRDGEKNTLHHKKKKTRFLSSLKSTGAR
jgi:hypothetical protein